VEDKQFLGTLPPVLMRAFIVLHPLRRRHNSHSSQRYKRWWKIPFVFGVVDVLVIFFSFFFLFIFINFFFLFLLFLFLFFFFLLLLFIGVVIPPSLHPHRCGAEPIELIIIILHGRALVGIS
jgi:hypothetical protein